MTQDDDYLRLHHRQHAHAGIAYCEQGARSIGQMIAALVLIYEVLTADEMEGRVEYL